MATSIENVLTLMLNAARTEADHQWVTAGASITSEFKVFGERLAQIAVTRENHEITVEDAREFFVAIHNNLVAMIAMTTALVIAAAQKIVNAALSAARVAINDFVKFPLLLA